VAKLPASGMTPAVVVGSGLGALGALRLLHRAGIPVYSLNVEPSFESRSRWFRPLPGVRETLAGGAPLARVPENTMKFAVGVMLSSYGLFFTAEGLGVEWPGGDAESTRRPAFGGESD